MGGKGFAAAKLCDKATMTTAQAGPDETKNETRKTFSIDDSSWTNLVRNHVFDEDRS